jgi:hypothetical protein
MAAIQTTPQLTAQQTIQLLADQHGIVHHHSALDELGEAFSRLSDNEVEIDKTEWLLVELDRANILTGAKNTLLHAQYLRQRQA